MYKRKNIEEQVEKTLECFKQVQSIEPNPFFYTRLEAEIESRQRQQNQSENRLITLNVIWPVFLALIIAINIISAVILFQNGEYQLEDRKEYLAAFAEEYSFNQSDYNYISNNNQE
jgi:cytochrome c-type biogenesis protein CcmH/NrfG